MDREFRMTLEWSVEANREVREIYEYLLDKAGERRASKILKRIYSHVQILESNPQAGQLEPIIDDLAKGYRRLVEGNYKILYYIKDETVVRISAVFDCRMDPAKIRKIKIFG